MNYRLQQYQQYILLEIHENNSKYFQVILLMEKWLYVGTLAKHNRLACGNNVRQQMYAVL